MRNLSLLALILAAGCWGDDGGGWRGGGDTLRSFETDASECALVSTLALSGTSTTWDACRLRYDDRAQVYTWQFMTPGTTGTWTAQGPGWFTMSFNVNSPQNRTLALSDVTAEEAPFVPVDQIVFAYAPTAGATVGALGSAVLGANIVYPNGDDSALEAQLLVDAVGFGSFTGSVSATIGPPVPRADAATPACADDGGCIE